MWFWLLLLLIFVVVDDDADDASFVVVVDDGDEDDNKNEPRHVKTCLRESDQVRFKLACSATETSLRLEILDTETRDITLPRQRTTKALVRLRVCAG